jgi:hypothetical protein
MSRTRQGKIARLPRALRDALNLKLEDNLPASQILPWLNGHAVVKEILEQHFEGAEISAQNLSEWRNGGYAEWSKGREKEESIRALADYSHRLAEAGGKDLSAGAVAIAAGKIYDVLESVATFDSDDETEEGKGEINVIESLARLRSLELATRRTDQRDRLVDLAQRKQDTKEREVLLAERRFETLAVENYITWSKSDEARKILDSGQAKHVQVARLRELMFGPSPVQEDSPENLKA